MNNVVKEIWVSNANDVIYLRFIDPLLYNALHEHLHNTKRVVAANQNIYKLILPFFLLDLTSDDLSIIENYSLP